MIRPAPGLAAFWNHRVFSWSKVVTGRGRVRGRERREQSLHDHRQSTYRGEGAISGEFSRRGKRRFYRIALPSATETAAILDVCRLLLELDDGTRLRAGRDLLLRIVAMLTRLAKA
jgi:hypothetical protein